MIESVKRTETVEEVLREYVENRNKSREQINQYENSVQSAKQQMLKDARFCHEKVKGVLGDHGVLNSEEACARFDGMVDQMIVQADRLGQQADIVELGQVE